MPLPSHGPSGTAWQAEALLDGGTVRTFDIHSPAPEFLHACAREVRRWHSGGRMIASPFNCAAFPKDSYFPRTPSTLSASGWWKTRWVSLPSTTPIAISTTTSCRVRWNFQSWRAIPLTINAAEPAVLQVTTPSLATGQATTRVVVTDRFGNPVRDAEGEVSLRTASGETTAGAQLVQH